MFALKIANPFNKLSRLHRLYVNSFRAGGQGPMRAALERASGVYMMSMFRRFSRYSMGGGNWRALAASTVLRKGHDAILVESDQLRTSLDPLRLRNSGLLSVGHQGFQVGIPSGMDHGGSSLDVASLAKVHHFGLASRRNKYLPARRILVAPDLIAQRRMMDEIVKGLRELVRQANV